MAFANGRRSVLNRDDGGALATGEPADVLLLDWNAVDDDRLRPDLDPLDLLFARTTARHIREVIVGGRSIVQDGRVTGIDFPAMRTELMDRLRAGLRQNASLVDALGELERAIARSFRNPAALLLAHRSDRSCRSPKSIASPHAAPDDVSGIESAIAAGHIDPKGVIAVLAKTEGNGLVNDFARGHATLALSLLFQRHLPPEEAARICLVMSGGTEGAMAPHWVVFERAAGDGANEPVTRDRPRPHAGAAVRASRPAGAGRSGRRRGARGHGRRRQSPTRPTCISCR